MKISKIEKKKRLYLLELDDSEQLYITEDTIVRFMLSKGMTISPETLTEIKSFSQFSYGKNLAIYFISFQVRTKKEVKDYLIKHEISKEYLDKILSSLEEDKWIDDTKYVTSYLNQNALNGDKGPAVIKQKLLQKGISLSDITDALVNLDFYPLAEKVGGKTLKKYQNKLPSKALEEKVIQTLVNKGFSYEQAKSVSQDLAIEEDHEQSQSLLEKELDKQWRKYSRKYEGHELKQKLFQSLYRKGFNSDSISQILRDYL
ncbi:recombination regulator RecX [Streptococcus iniae]|uniref:recombination regulator RecX n=1 Tax=Streptococcus iniae TaxID=1346 RepID=UPI000EF6A058|nr:recombination regulator RecX [Streptococcus iniae]RLU62603.1 recombination regulator RecX [Streptococcus iniae]RLU64013.1 recombination regulator RecX [Streptococcus iniae]RLU72304.1 recombination regulator RecX [Streptococcus iniae]RLU86447.1 recombination regulator RecX [Streptococcus iniae]RLU86498.1 recombination regulator RecX [Streptococcus iniae]